MKLLTSVAIIVGFVSLIAFFIGAPPLVAFTIGLGVFGVPYLLKWFVTVIDGDFEI